MPSPWLAMEVRPWLVLSVVLLAVAISMSAFRLRGYLHERRILGSAGVIVQATVQTIGNSQAREGSRDEVQHISVTYTAPDGQVIESANDLPRKPGDTIAFRQIIPVRIDPEDPTFWTAREEPLPLASVLFVPMLCAPAAVICAAIAILRERSIRAIIANAAARRASVVNVKLSPLAPMSKLIGLTLADDPARRVLHCYWPASRGVIRAGDVVEVKINANGKHVVVG